MWILLEVSDGEPCPVNCRDRLEAASFSMHSRSNFAVNSLVKLNSVSLQFSGFARFLPTSVFL